MTGDKGNRQGVGALAALRYRPSPPGKRIDADDHRSKRAGRVVGIGGPGAGRRLLLADFLELFFLFRI